MPAQNSVTLKRLHVRIPDVPKERDKLLLALYDLACTKFRALAKRSDIPIDARPLLDEMVAVAWNRLKAEGLTGISISGISESYVDGLPQDLLAAILSYRIKRLRTF
ncbi:MAG: hypothetical protein FWF10_08045 [Clostridiales bacterium]|nr:hypothetical protein [Clostridiales bacterium]